MYTAEKPLTKTDFLGAKRYTDILNRLRSDELALIT